MQWQTHTVFNQPLPLHNSNLFLSDRTLHDAVVCDGGGAVSDNSMRVTA